MTRQELETMKSIDITTVKADTLVEITEISIDAALPKSEKMLEYIRKIQNPYCFKCLGTIIKLGFSNTDATFEDGMINYLAKKMELTKG